MRDQPESICPLSVELLIESIRADLDTIAPCAGTRGIRSRLRLFQMMHLQNQEWVHDMPLGTKVLVLRLESKEIIVCDEYDPKDQGRVHIIPNHRYAIFDQENMTLEYDKVTMDVEAVLYDDWNWPEGVETPISHYTILQYFTGITP